MSSSLKKVISWVAILVILGATIFGIVWVSNNFGKLQSGTDLYTKEQLDDKYNEGYKKGQEEGEQWRVKYQDANSQLSEAEENVKKLQQNMADLEKQIQNSSGEKTQLEERIKETERQLQEQKNEVKRLESLIEEYEALKNGRAEVNFYYTNYAGQDELLTTKLTTKNQIMKDIPTFEGAGYKFEGWTINRNDVVELQSTEIQEDTNFYAKTTFKTLEECSWDEIDTISESGYASNVFNVGDEKTVHISHSNAKYYDEDFKFRILDFKHDDLSDGSGKAGISFGMVSCFPEHVHIVPGGETIDVYVGWKDSGVRDFLNNDVFSRLPADLQRVIKAVDKKSSEGVLSSYVKGDCNIGPIEVTSDKLWELSFSEIASKELMLNYDADDSEFKDYVVPNLSIYFQEGEQYAFFKNLLKDCESLHYPYAKGELLEHTLHDNYYDRDDSFEFVSRSFYRSGGPYMGVLTFEGERVNANIVPMTEAQSSESVSSFCFCV